MILLTEYHAVKSVYENPKKFKEFLGNPYFDGRNPPAVDEIAFAMKYCFAGLTLDGFDFIQGVSWISSERSEDFIVV